MPLRNLLLAAFILVGAAGFAGDLYTRLAGKAPLVDTHGCAALAAASAGKLEDRLRKERSSGREF